MIIFRVIERLGLNSMFGTGWVQYAATVFMVLTGAIIFSVVMQKIIVLIGNRIRTMVLRN